jgi:hypothetical protein
MHLPTLIAVFAPALTVAGIGYAAVVKLTRMAVALERLSSDMAAVLGKVDNHEGRLLLLEAARGRHRAR